MIHLLHCSVPNEKKLKSAFMNYILKYILVTKVDFGTFVC